MPTTSLRRLSRRTLHTLLPPFTLSPVSTSTRLLLDSSAATLAPPHAHHARRALPLRTVAHPRSGASTSRRPPKPPLPTRATRTTTRPPEHLPRTPPLRSGRSSGCARRSLFRGGPHTKRLLKTRRPHYTRQTFHTTINTFFTPYTREGLDWIPLICYPTKGLGERTRLFWDHVVVDMHIESYSPPCRCHAMHVLYAQCKASMSSPNTRIDTDKKKRFEYNVKVGPNVDGMLTARLGLCLGGGETIDVMKSWGGHL